MEDFRSDDNLVGKYIHADGSETAIKCVSSCDTVRDPATGRLHRNTVDRRKYSIFVSSSVGCYMSCNFCYLTLKRSRYGKLKKDRIVANLKEAVVAEFAANPEVRDRYVKLNWMGMGEDHLRNPERTAEITLEMLDWLIAEGYALGLDGVDIATVLPPKLPESWIPTLQALDAALARYPLNPANRQAVHASNGYVGYVNRSRLRLFYSLHSAVQETRDRMIPRALPLSEALQALKGFSKNDRYNLIFHHMFIAGQNDAPAEVEALLSLVRDAELKPFEFRILRYNACDNSPFHETSGFDAIVERLAAEIPRLKVQISTGTEVRAACGQFIVTQFQPRRALAPAA